MLGIRHRACALTGTRVSEVEPMKPSTSLPVLVVDDNEEVREAVSEVLRTEGFGVAQAADGKEALTYLQAHDTALVFLDLKMPVVDGVSFLQLLRSAARKN